MTEIIERPKTEDAVFDPGDKVILYDERFRYKKGVVVAVSWGAYGTCAYEVEITIADGICYQRDTFFAHELEMYYGL